MSRSTADQHPSSIRSASTAWPCAPVYQQDDHLLAPRQAVERRAPVPRPAAAKRDAGKGRAHSLPSLASSACAASMLARIEPVGLVVWVASKARSSRAGSSRRSGEHHRALRVAAAPCGAVTIASAPARRAAAGQGEAEVRGPPASTMAPTSCAAAACPAGRRSCRRRTGRRGTRRRRRGAASGLISTATAPGGRRPGQPRPDPDRAQPGQRQAEQRGPAGSR